AAGGWRLGFGDPVCVAAAVGEHDVLGVASGPAGLVVLEQAGGDEVGDELSGSGSGAADPAHDALVAGPTDPVCLVGGGVGEREKRKLLRLPQALDVAGPVDQVEAHEPPPEAFAIAARMATR